MAAVSVPIESDENENKYVVNDVRWLMSQVNLCLYVTALRNRIEESNQVLLHLIIESNIGAQYHRAK